MITQYSRVQLTLSEKEKEYAWFSYAAKIIRAGCNDQQMSGLDLCQYFEHKKLKGYADFFNSSSSFCCGVI